MVASWAAGHRLSVQVISAEQPRAAAIAQPCTTQGETSPHMKVPNTTPSAATCASAISMKTIPRLSTIAPSGTWVARTSSPATSAGPSMVRLRACIGTPGPASHHHGAGYAWKRTVDGLMAHDSPIAHFGATHTTGFYHA